jgi:uncharacterized protein (UPF0333 family)
MGMETSLEFMLKILSVLLIYALIYLLVSAYNKWQYENIGKNEK